MITSSASFEPASLPYTLQMKVEVEASTGCDIHIIDAVSDYGTVLRESASAEYICAGASLTARVVEKRVHYLIRADSYAGALSLFGSLFGLSNDGLRSAGGGTMGSNCGVEPRPSRNRAKLPLLN